MREKFSEYCEVISGFAFKSKDLLREGDIPVLGILNGIFRIRSNKKRLEPF